MLSHSFIWKMLEHKVFRILEDFVINIGVYWCLEYIKNMSTGGQGHSSFFDLLFKEGGGIGQN